MKVVLRQANITFSKDFVDLNKQNGIVLTRKNLFGYNAVCINHGNSNPIKLKNIVTKFYLINKPEKIHLCSNKIDNWKLLQEFYPRTYQHPSDVQHYPVIAKPVSGHHGYGIEICKNEKELRNCIRKGTYIVQDLIDVKHEYRFNVLDGDIYQISKKSFLEGMNTPLGGYQFSYKSLGVDADLSNKFKTFVNNIITRFTRQVGVDIGDYCIDIMKDKDSNYYLTEINSAYGIGQFTLEKLIDIIYSKYEGGDLDKYRVR